MTRLEMCAVVIFSAAAGAVGGIAAHAVTAAAAPIVTADQDVRYLSPHEALTTTSTQVNGALVVCTQYINTRRRTSTLAC